jgi:hypothetical protein
MFKSIIKIAAGTALFAGIHTLLASRAAKEKAAKLFGERKRNGLYRPLYNGLAIATLGGLGLYGLRLPDHILYRACGPAAGIMHFIQFCSVLYLLSGVRQIGLLKFAGAPNIGALLTGQSVVPREPEAQGPALENGNPINGPFRFSRHPLNFGILPVIWLMPRMTVNLAVFNLVTTLYLVLGSLHEEKRLREAYGDAYLDYQRSGINFLVPGFNSFSARRVKEFEPPEPEK